MKWIKIEDGCEMPKTYEIVAVSGSGLWFEAFLDTSGNWNSEGRPKFNRRIPTHWARVELPEE